MTTQCLKCGVELREGPVIYINDSDYYCLRCAPPTIKPKRDLYSQTWEGDKQTYVCAKCNDDIYEWQNMVRKNEWFMAWNDQKKVMTYYHTRCFTETKLSLVDD